MTEIEKWEAVAGRDGRYEGRFVFGVVTTGVYCRPGCGARLPRPENVRFFATGTEAEAAGFRACKRCRPTGAESAAERKRRALRAAGVAERDWKRAERLEELKAALRRGATVTEAQYEAGYGSSSRLYETAVERIGMTPGEYRRGGRGMRIGYAIANSPVGRILAAATARGVCAIRIGENDADLLASVEAEFPAATLEPDGAGLARHLAAIVNTLGSGRAAQAVPLDLRGTAFQIRVWEELRKIPRGETRTYTQVAAAVGRPAAVRAVARAIATNPAALVVPCHRVIRTDGSLAGYRWGVEKKRALLAAEARSAH